MKASEVEAELKRLRELHGDLEVVIEWPGAAADRRDRLRGRGG